MDNDNDAEYTPFGTNSRSPSDDAITSDPDKDLRFGESLLASDAAGHTDHAYLSGWESGSFQPNDDWMAFLPPDLQPNATWLNYQQSHHTLPIMEENILNPISLADDGSTQVESAFSSSVNQANKTRDMGSLKIEFEGSMEQCETTLQNGKASCTARLKCSAYTDFLTRLSIIGVLYNQTIEIKDTVVKKQEMKKIKSQVRDLRTEADGPETKKGDCGSGQCSKTFKLFSEDLGTVLSSLGD